MQKRFQAPLVTLAGISLHFLFFHLFLPAWCKYQIGAESEAILSTATMSEWSSCLLGVGTQHDTVDC